LPRALARGCKRETLLALAKIEKDLAKAYHHYYLTHELKLMATSLETPA
jgi:hypothetical protein